MTTQTALFSPLGVETAPEKSRPLLEKIQKSFKFIPNLFGVFANSPVLLEGYLGLEGVFEKGSLSAVERSIVLLAASVENSCKYCTAAHSTVLKAFLHVPADVVSAVRSNLPVSDPKLKRLSPSQRRSFLNVDMWKRRRSRTSWPQDTVRIKYSRF